MFSNIKSAFGRMVSNANSVSGAGGSGDHSGASVEIRPRLSPMYISALLRQDAMMRMAVEAMPEDIIRVWRKRTDNNDKWLKIEKKLKYRKAIEKALVWADSFGGALIVPRYDSSVVSLKDMAKPFKQPRSGSLIGFKVYMPHELKAHWGGRHDLGTQIDNDLPEKFRIETRQGKHVIIHHSWTIPVFGAFRSDYLDMDRYHMDSCDHAFGESRVDMCFDALMRMNIALQNTSHMLAKANLDTLQIEGLAAEIASCATIEEAQLQIQGAIARAAAAVQGASIYQPMVIDKEEKLERQGMGSGSSSVDKMTDLMVSMYVAVTKVPRTRLMGEQISGLSGDDDGGLKHYYDRCDTMRVSRLTDVLDAMDEITVNDGGVEAELWQYNKLWILSDKDVADIEYKNAQSDNVYLNVEGFGANAMVHKRLADRKTYGGVNAD